MAKKQLHAYFSGRVHGVGFRMTVESLAAELGEVVGWVKNLYDGRVEVVAEGEEATLQTFLQRIQQGPLQRYIRAVEPSWHDATGQFTTFGIRF